MSPKYQALLIDDSKSVSFFNKIMLERSTFFSKVEIKKNGLEALSLLDTGYSPDIIFLDINMPIMNGWEFLEEYTTSQNKQCPIVLLSGAEQSNTDKSKLQRYAIVKGVREKMLSLNSITELKNTIFDA